jgi:rhamnulokinase
MTVAPQNGHGFYPGARFRPSVVAVDLGAESCRVSLLQWIEEEPRIRLVHRFSNAPVLRGSHLYWDLNLVLRGVEEGLRACAELAAEGIASIGVDGWAVDYVHLDPSGAPEADPFCYRDERTKASQKNVHARISPERLYELTGVQDLALNTLYQLSADRISGGSTAPWINLPEFVLHRLGGRRVAEYTNATHSQLLGINGKNWCAEIFQAAGLGVGAAPVLVPPGTDVGTVQGKLALLPAFRKTTLIAPACHDTASAIAGIQAQGEDWAFISSGTWSLVGCVLDSPCVSSEARSKNFSNEGGIGGKVNFLKNVNGMWLLQQCVEQWRSEGKSWTVEALVESCRGLPTPECVLDLDDPEFLLPGDMPARMNSQLARRSQNLISADASQAPRMARLLFHSLAERYAVVLRDMARIAGKKLHRIFIVGGGSKNTLLNELTARATKLEVITCSAESATIGNLAIQLSALAGDYSEEIGVRASSVANWADFLMARPMEDTVRKTEPALHA